MIVKVFRESEGFPSTETELNNQTAPLKSCYINNDYGVKGECIIASGCSSWWELSIDTMDELKEHINSLDIDCQIAMDVYFDEVHLIIMDKSYVGCCGHRCN